MANEIIMNEVVIPGHAHRTGDTSFVLSENKELKIETSPNGDNMFSGVVPAGKTWNVTVYLRIDET